MSVPAAHPGIDGRADELAELARSVRRLVAATVLNRAPAPDLMAFTRELDDVVGRYTPLALPVAIEFDGDRVIGRASFTTPYEGPPGCVHGAVIAATFDIVLTAANMLAKAPGLTVSLSTRYRRPTRLHVESRFEAWVERVDERRTYTHGRIVQGDVVTVESEGIFARLQAGSSSQVAGRGSSA